MKSPSFIEGAGVGVVAAVAAAVVVGGLGAFYSAGFVLRLAIAGLALAYVVYLLMRSEQKVGRVTTMAAWMVASALLWLTGASLSLFVVTHLGMIWLVRALYFHGSLLAALADLVLVGFGLLAAVWAWLETGSLFVTTWCFFLVQAAFVAIPSMFAGRTANASKPTDSATRFQQAHRAAEAAVSRLSVGR